jgi:hypothetical protein
MIQLKDIRRLLLFTIKVFDQVGRGVISRVVSTVSRLPISVIARAHMRPTGKVNLAYLTRLLVRYDCLLLRDRVR